MQVARMGASAKAAVGEFLRRLPGREVGFVARFEQVEAGADFRGQRLGIVSDHVEAAALGGAVESEGGEDEMAVGGQGLVERAEVVLAVGWIGEEVEHGAVVPEREAMRGLEVGDIGFKPVDGGGALAEAFFGVADGGGGDIEDGDVFEACVQQGIDEEGRAATHVNDALVFTDPGRLDEVERQGRMRLMPA